MRPALLTLIFASLVAETTASAEVIGDATAGVAGDTVNPQLGLRAGAATDEIGALVSADWTYVRGIDPADVSEYRDRFRALAHIELPFEIARGTRLAIRIGGGIELSRLTQSGGFLVGPATPMTTHDRDLGSAWEVAAGCYHDAGGIAIGGELGVATALHDAPEITRYEHQRTEIFARLVGRFAR